MRSENPVFIDENTEIEMEISKPAVFQQPDRLERSFNADSHSSAGGQLLHPSLVYNSMSVTCLGSARNNSPAQNPGGQLSPKAGAAAAASEIPFMRRMFMFL